MLAPIIIFCYNRPSHLQQTVESLLRNPLASQSPLYIFSDGPKTGEDYSKVTAVRQYIQTIQGFASLHISISESNKGLATSVITGVTQVLEKYTKVIVLEDDMICSSDFLNYCNEALAIYVHRKDIFSISGYGPKLDFPTAYPYDLYLAPRASSWGWCTWRDRWELADWEVSDFEMMRKRPDLQKKLNQGGEDLWPMLVKQQKGLISSWAVRWTWTQSKHNAYGIYPRQSKIRNIGTDGSGENFSVATSAYDNQIWEGQVKMPLEIAPNEELIQIFSKSHQLSWYRKWINRIKLGY